MKNTIIKLVGVSSLFVAFIAQADSSNGNGLGQSGETTLSIESISNIETITSSTSTVNADFSGISFTGGFNGVVIGSGDITGSSFGSVASLPEGGVSAGSESTVSGNLAGDGMISAGVSGSVVTQSGNMTSTTNVDQVSNVSTVNLTNF